MIKWLLVGSTKSLNVVQLQTSKKGRQANLAWSVGGPPKMQFANTEPLLDLRRGDRFGEAVVIECDRVNFGATLGTPCQIRFCAPNDKQRLSLNGDPGRSRGHGLLHFVHLGGIPNPNARRLRECPIKVFRNRLRISQGFSASVLPCK